MPRDRKLILHRSPESLELLVSGPEIQLDPLEDYRELNFEIPKLGRCRAVFFLLPDKNSLDVNVIRPLHRDQWNVPVKWDDPTMLYVPSLDDHSLLDAMNYIFDNSLEREVFERVA